MSSITITNLPDFVMESLGFAFGKVGEMSKQLFAQAIATLGINEQHLYVLYALENLGPQVQAHLSKPLQIDKATMVEVINHLERNGLVQRLPHPNDRRAVLVHITEAGRDKIQQSIQLTRAFTDRFFEGLSQDERAALSRALKKLAANAVTMAESGELVKK